jgi:predicted flavoprotein YhiN
MDRKKIQEKNKSKIAVIGGGAAGFFGAINIAEKNLNYEVILFESSQKVLSKVFHIIPIA